MEVVIGSIDTKNGTQKYVILTEENVGNPLYAQDHVKIALRKQKNGHLSSTCKVPISIGKDGRYKVVDYKQIEKGINGHGRSIAQMVEGYLNLHKTEIR